MAFDDRRGATARLTFDAASGPHSTNNLNRPEHPGFAGRRVPRGSIHLLAEGRFGDRRSLMECILTAPGFRYAIASGGPIVSDGGLLVAGIESKDGVPTDYSTLDPRTLPAGHIGSNRSLSLGTHTLITGDASAVNRVTLNGESIEVLGAITNGSEAIALPTITASRFDPVDGVPLGNGLQSPTLTGTMRAAGDVTIEGDARLDNATVYVPGNLHITGGLKGRGALFATGKVSIDDAVALTTDDQVAIVADAGIDITGRDQAQSAIRGLVVTNGPLKASRVNLVGAFVSTCTAGDAMTLHNARVLFDGSVTSMDLEYTSTRTGRLFVRYDRFTGSISLLPSRPEDSQEVLCAIKISKEGDEYVATFHAFRSAEEFTDRDRSLGALADRLVTMIQGERNMHVLDTMRVHRFIGLADRLRVIYWAEIPVR